MIHTFIEFEYRCLGVKALHYLIDRISDDFYQYLIFPENNLKLDTYNDIKIKRIKKLESNDLKLYQEVFGFVGEQFTSANNNHTLYFAEKKFLKTECIKLINSIFDIIKITDPKFAFSIHFKLISDLNYLEINLKIFRDNLNQWKKYLDYKKYIQDFKLDNNWDTNLNTILDQYLNPNPYCCINKVYWFISGDYIFKKEETKRQELIEFLNVDEAEILKECTSSEYYKYTQYIQNLLQYMDKYHKNIIYKSNIYEVHEVHEVHEEHEDHEEHIFELQ